MMKLGSSRAEMRPIKRYVHRTVEHPDEATKALQTIQDQPERSNTKALPHLKSGSGSKKDELDEHSSQRSLDLVNHQAVASKSLKRLESDVKNVGRWAAGLGYRAGARSILDQRRAAAHTKTEVEKRLRRVERDLHENIQRIVEEEAKSKHAESEAERRGSACLVPGLVEVGVQFASWLKSLWPPYPS